MRFPDETDADKVLEVRRYVPGNGRVSPSGSLPEYCWRDHVFTAAELYRMTFPPVEYVVPDLIPEGLSIIAGRPKIGKSWLAMDICIAVAAGRSCLGERKPKQGDVLYAAMEDNPRRLQRRIDKLLSPFGAQWPERLMLTTSWRRLDKGGVDDISKWIESVPEPRLVILDTFAGVKPIRTQQGYIEDYQSLDALHRLANEHGGLAIPVLTHQRKMEAEDPLDTVTGTLGLAGAADTVLVLNRTSKGTTLYVRGRDIEEAEHAISFDKKTCRWTILGDAAEVHRSAERGRILAVLTEAEEPMGPSEIAGAAGMPVNNAKQLLFKMTAAGEVEKGGRGQYLHPNNRRNNRPDSRQSGKSSTPRNFVNPITNAENDSLFNDMAKSPKEPQGDQVIGTEPRLSKHRSYRIPEESPYRPQTKDGYQVIGAEPNGALCSQCGRSHEWGTVYLIRTKGVHSEPLHEDCAKAWIK